MSGERAFWATVQLRHTLPDGTAHIDWMIAPDHAGRDHLVTFRSPGRIDELAPGSSLALERLHDHRPAYLTYEGPVSGGRGSVRRVGQGRITAWLRDPDRWRLSVAWDARPPQHLGVRRVDDGSWLVRSEPRDPSNMEQ